jgi:hypothetical protein
MAEDFDEDYQVKDNDGNIIDKYTDCDLGCGGQMEWCSCCQTYTSVCCIPYGTCLCS